MHEEQRQRGAADSSPVTRISSREAA